MLNIAITGAGGRMGQTLIRLLADSDEANLTVAVERKGSPHVGVDVVAFAATSPSGVVVVDDIESAIEQFDILIDFSHPEATVDNIEVCKRHGKAMVIGTTGMSTNQIAQVQTASQQIPICMASNFATGVNLCFKLAEMAARVLGDEIDVEISETHHRHKKDAPSGTALSLGRSVASALNQDFDAVARFGMERQVSERDNKTIGFSSVRAGDVVGDHTVLFAAEGERIEITHKASSRAAFARGALRAAHWLNAKAPGLYDMQDVLNLK